MFKKASQFTIALALAGLLASPFANAIHAQDGEGLSEEEIALVEKFIAATELQDEYTSYTALSTENLVMNMNLVVAGQEIAFSQNKDLQTEGYIVIGEDGAENSSSTSTLVFSEVNADGEVSYTINAEVIALGDALYVNAAYETAEGEVGEFPEGWQVYTAAEDLPIGLDEFDFADFFEEEDAEVWEDPEVLLNAVTEVTSEPTTIETEEGDIEGELITMIIGPENFASFLAAVSDDEEGEENPFTAIFEAEGADAAIAIAAVLDSEGALISVAMEMSFAVVDMDASVLSADLPPDSLLSLDMTASFAGGIAGVDLEYPAIEAPEAEGATEGETEETEAEGEAE